MTISFLYKLLILLQPNLIGGYIIISWSVFCKYWIAVVKDTVTVKAQNFIESLSVLYFCTSDIFAVKLGVLMYYCEKPFHIQTSTLFKMRISLQAPIPLLRRRLQENTQLLSELRQLGKWALTILPVSSFSWWVPALCLDSTVQHSPVWMVVSRV